MFAFFLVSFLASIAGTICGIGGGVIIKPVLDMLKLETVATASFLSGCTVLSMSTYSVLKSLRAKEKTVDIKTGTPLAAGAAAGGLIGKTLFNSINAYFSNPNAVGVVQAVCLAVVTIGTLVYTLKKETIQTRRITSPVVCILIGATLGIMSSFLGIGGGPINLVVLFYFFSMDTKTAAANSLYIILFSQAANLLFTIFSGSVPNFRWGVLLLMVTGGISGGITGRTFTKRMNNRAVDKLFITLLLIIILICIYNVYNLSTI